MGNCALRCVKRQRSSKASKEGGTALNQPVQSKPTVQNESSNNTLPLLVVTEATPLSQLTTKRRAFLSSINVIKSSRLDIPFMSLGELLWNQLHVQPASEYAFAIFERDRITYGQLIDEVRLNMRVLTNLLDSSTNGSILILSSNRVSVVSLLIACHRMNVRVALMNPNFTAYLVDDLREINTTCIFTSLEYIEKTKELRDALEIQHCIVMDSGGSDLPRDFQSLTEVQKFPKSANESLKHVMAFWEVRQNMLEPILTVWTMGRSSGPKMVHLTNKNLTTSVCIIRHVTQFDRNMRILNLLPLFHPFSLTLGLYNSLISGCTLTMLSKVGPEDFLRCAEQDGITACLVIPSILEFLAFNNLVNEHRLRSLEVVFNMAGPVDEFIFSALQKRLPGLILYNTYGLCEATSITHMTLSIDKVPRSIGSLLPNMECKIMNLQTGRAECSGRMGEIVLRGPLVAEGVTEEPTALTYLDNYGWLHTGDIGFHDQDDNFYVTATVQSRNVRQATNCRRTRDLKIWKGVSSLPAIDETPTRRISRMNNRSIPLLLITSDEESGNVSSSDSSTS